MYLSGKHFVIRKKALRIFLVYFMYGIIFVTSEVVLVAIAIEIMLIQIELGGLRFVIHSIISLSELIFHSM